MTDSNKDRELKIELHNAPKPATEPKDAESIELDVQPLEERIAPRQMNV